MGDLRCAHHPDKFTHPEKLPTRVIGFTTSPTTAQHAAKSDETLRQLSRLPLTIVIVGIMPLGVKYFFIRITVLSAKLDFGSHWFRPYLR